MAGRCKSEKKQKSTIFTAKANGSEASGAATSKGPVAVEQRHTGQEDTESNRWTRTAKQTGVGPQIWARRSDRDAFLLSPAVEISACRAGGATRKREKTNRTQRMARRQGTGKGVSSRARPRGGSSAVVDRKLVMATKWM
ncbi:hypothetical protein SPBR_08748 [Sporothrix brasiliensis 5110]|uniref:Uncharacterized protein n=1 Tax=Sporothrix brasiliensis 5110 TaxID=1398154 RepID=A0A0C2ELC7_9PEZI|nr:uncharacterized protein SPBR_08748 [Sporothrix brasiliensis 5110]KIH86899.1 hypothetical protein SPBR_08748 [Sporothrix brasiliensis 5110]